MEIFYILIVVVITHKCIHLSELIELQHLKLMDFIARKLCFSKIHFKSIWELLVTSNKYSISFGGDGNILELDSGGGCTASEYTKNY